MRHVTASRPTKSGSDTRAASRSAQRPSGRDGTSRVGRSLRFDLRHGPSVLARQVAKSRHVSNAAVRGNHPPLAVELAPRTRPGTSSADSSRDCVTVDPGWPVGRDRAVL